MVFNIVVRCWKETETEEKVGFFGTFLSLVKIQ